MFRKTFIRLFLMMLLVSGGLFLIAANADRYKANKTARNESPEASDATEQGITSAQFTIWESLSRAIIGSVHY
jgi:hypothetical protein